MKVIFVLDDMSVFVTTPEELQLRQTQDGIAALIAPTGKKNEEGEDTFLPLISYPVYLSSVPLPEGFNPHPAPETVEEVPAEEAEKTEA